MTVVLDTTQSKELFGANPDESKRHCSLCTEPLQPPYVYYHGYGDESGDRNLFICDRCVVKFGRGLMADILEVLANRELSTVYGKDTYFQRVSGRKLREERKRWADGA